MKRDTPNPGRPADLQAFLDDHGASDEGQVFGITELVDEFGVTPRTIRFYEDQGLLSPRRLGTVRIFSRRDRARLALIIRAKALGSSLGEIKQYLELYGRHGEGRSQQLEFVVKKAGAALIELRQKQAQIATSIAEIELIRRSCEEQLLARKRKAGAKR